MTEVVFGVPGSGKTTYLLNKIEELVTGGYSPRDIAYLTMTRNARAVARKRMEEKFGATKDDLLYFRTVHSICYEIIGRPEKVTEKEKAEFCKTQKVDYEEAGEGGGETYELMGQRPTTLGGLYFTVYDQIRLLHEKQAAELEWGEFNRIWTKACSGMVTDSQQLRASKNGEKAFEFIQGWEAYKRMRGRVDYADMLIIAYRNGSQLPTTVLIVDEFQDLSPLMYSIYQKWSEGKEKIFIAGDDDQSIYSFLGACPDHLLMEKDSADNVVTLTLSHRCVMRNPPPDNPTSLSRGRCNCVGRSCGEQGSSGRAWRGSFRENPGCRGSHTWGISSIPSLRVS
jgi:superfamily I DNA/RNA helicase